MVKNCQRLFYNVSTCKVMQANAEQVVNSGLIKRTDLVAAFWSLSYPIQEFFSLTMQEDGKIIQSVSTEEGTRRAEAFLSELFSDGKSRSYIFTYFVSDSEEQQWVSKQWERIGPLPGGSRDYTWRLLEAHLSKLATQGHYVKIDNIEGVLACEDKVRLCNVFLDHHLRGLLPEAVSKEQLCNKLISNMSAFISPSGAFHIPSAFRLV